MADVVDNATRSRMMSGIHGGDTRPELATRRYLHQHGFRYRLHRRDLPGRPDLVLSRYRAVVFVHGCFWHAHAGCKYFTVPKSRSEFWTNKLEGNRARDNRQVHALLEGGWRVAVVWECAVRAGDSDLARVAEWLRGDAAYIEVSA